MRCSLGISNFLEEIFSVSDSIVFLYFFALFTLSLHTTLWNSAFWWVYLSFSPLPFTSLHSRLHLLNISTHMRVRTLNSPDRKWKFTAHPWPAPMLFNTRSGFVIAFLQRGKCHLISWLQSPSAVISEPKKIKSVTDSTFSPSICHEVMGPDAMILVF